MFDNVAKYALATVVVGFVAGAVAFTLTSQFHILIQLAVTATSAFIAGGIAWFLVVAKFMSDGFSEMGEVDL